MRFSVFNDTEWLYPDTPHNSCRSIYLDGVPGGHAGIQVLGDELTKDAYAYVQWIEDPVPQAELFQLLSVGVDENTSPTLMTTTDYESCRDFVTRPAPFRVYDALRPTDGVLHPAERLALYMTIEIPEDAAPGQYSGMLTIRTEGQGYVLPLCCTIHPLRIPSVKNARLGMLNFFDYDGLAAQHSVQKNSPKYWELFRKYVRAQISMRCTHILLPAGEPIFHNGVLTDFDFSAAEHAGKIARQEGAKMLCGGHIAHWKEWDDAEYYPNWDPAVGISTPQGYLQLRLYFSQWAQVIRRNRWQSCMTQALADEPQVHNEQTYRVLACMCRKFLPTVSILDAVETVNLGGGIDIWVPKQDTYEKCMDSYKALQDAGETMWFYTCAFPAGAAMNRSMDLPLSVSRLILWMGALYRLSGFLHWGFNYYIGDDIWNRACCPHKGALLPAGDAHIVYPGDDGPWRSMRYEMQRAGAEDYELLLQAMALAPERVETLIRTVCSDFRTYTAQGSLVVDARQRLIYLLEEVGGHG